MCARSLSAGVDLGESSNDDGDEDDEEDDDDDDDEKASLALTLLFDSAKK